MSFVIERRRLLFAIAAAALVLIVAVGPSYGDLQTVDTATAFRALADEDTDRYVAAGLIDFVFAAAYGLAALTMPMKMLVSRVGAGLIALGALADEAENVTLLRNIAKHATLTDADVDLMRIWGQVKWTLILLGLALLFAAVLWERRAHIGQWIATSRAWYLAFLGVVLLMVPIAQLRLPWQWLVPFLVALAYLGSRLNDVVRKDRATSTPHATARVLLATLQLAVGGLAAYLGYTYEGWLADIAFFLGVALIVMSLGAYVSELRETAWFPTRRGLVLVLCSLGLLVYATMADRSAAVALAILGVLIGEIGTELLSRDFLGWTLPVPNWTIGGLGVIVLVTGAALFVSTGLDPAHAALVIAALAAIVYFASADGDALIIVLLVAYALVWAVSPEEAEIEPDRRPVAGEPYFVVLGDSYISGEGAHTFIEGTNEKVHGPDDPNRTHENECRRATTAWPFVVAEIAAEKKSTVVPSRVMFLGCSGAVSENISTLPRRNSKGEQQGPAELDLFLKQKKQLQLDPPKFVVLSIGGNDSGFGDIGKTCVAPGSCAEIAEQFLRGRDADEPQQVDGPPGGGKAESLADIRDDLRAAYARVRNVVGENVPVIAVPYPTPLTQSGRCRGVLLDDEERRFIRGFVPELNGVIRDVATEEGSRMYVLDGMQDGLRGVGAQLCSKVAGRAGLNFFALNPTSGSLADSLNPKNWVHNSLHPNADGHRALANVAYQWLSTELPGSEPPEHGPHTISSIRTVLDGASVTQCNIADRASCDIDKGDWVSEQVHDFFGRALFPLAVVMFGLWLCINPMLRWAATKTPPVTLASIVWPGLHDAASRAWGWMQWLWHGP
jgi:lysophospholipase L1-like esterase